MNDEQRIFSETEVAKGIYERVCERWKTYLNTPDESTCKTTLEIVDDVLQEVFKKLSKKEVKK